MPPKKQKQNKKKRAANGQRQQPSRSRAAGRAMARRSAVPRGPMLDSATRLFLLAQHDPWAGKGAKWPDQNESYSVPLQVFTRNTAAITAAGNRIIRIYPGILTDAFYVSPTIVANAVTDWGSGTNVANYTPISTDFDQYRVVSCGIRIRYVGNNFYNSGILTVRLQPTFAHGAAVGPLGQDSYTTKYKIVPFKSGMVVSPKNVGIEAQHYDDVTSATAGLPNWEAVTIFVTGADGTNPQSFVIETVHNLELLPKANTTVSTLASAPANYHPDALRAVSLRNSNIASSFR